MATLDPKTARSRCENIGVSAISGTSINADLPRSRVSRIARIYISVFPLPVTPCSRKRFVFCVAKSSVIAENAARCSSVSVKSVTSGSSSFSNGSLRTSSISTSIKPRFLKRRHRRTADVCFSQKVRIWHLAAGDRKCGNNSLLGGVQWFIVFTGRDLFNKPNHLSAFGL